MNKYFFDDKVYTSWCGSVVDGVPSGLTPKCIYQNFCFFNTYTNTETGTGICELGVKFEKVTLENGLEPVC